MNRPFHILQRWRGKKYFDAEFKLINEALLIHVASGRPQPMQDFSPEARAYYWGVTGSAGLPAFTWRYGNQNELQIGCPHCHRYVDPKELEEFAEKLVCRKLAKIEINGAFDGAIDVIGQYDVCDDEEDARFACPRCSEEFVAPAEFVTEYI